MKKKVLLVMGLCAMLLVGGCSKKEAATDIDGVPVKGEYKVKNHIKLGEYKGIEVSVEKIVITDADVEAEILYEIENLNATEDVTDRDVVQEGDIANIDFEGLRDGVAFEGGTGTNYNLNIGAGGFIEGFEEGLIGKKVGEKVALDLTFPENYSNSPELAGQPVVFNVTINAIKKAVKPELTEEFVKNHTKYASIAEYKKTMRELLETESQEIVEYNKQDNVLSAILEKAEIKSLPQTVVDFYAYQAENYYELNAAMRGMTLDDFLTQNQTTREQFDTFIKTMAERQTKYELVQKAVANAEKLTVTDEEFQTAVDENMASADVATEEELFEKVSKELIKEDILLKKALKFVVDNAVIQEVEDTATPTPTPAE